MKRMAVVLGLILSCNVWATFWLDAGTFSLSRATRAKEFTSLLADYNRFADSYLEVTSDSDLSPCEGWGSFTKISSAYIDMCTRTSKLGYNVQVISQFKAAPLTDTRCLSKVNYALQIMSETRPNLLPDNVRLVQTEFCLNPDGRTVTYNSSIEEGPRKSILFPFIVLEFKKLIPTLIKSVKILVQ